MPAPKGHPNYDVNHLAGRPPRYTEEDINKFADELLIWLRDPKHIFFIDFCLDRDIDPDLMSEWARDNKRFSGAYKIAKRKQESKLLNGAVLKEFDSSFTKFLLVNNHGYAEKTESKVSVTTNPMSVIFSEVDGTSKDLVNE